MADLIERQDVLDEMQLCDFIRVENSEGDVRMLFADSLEERINDIPSAEPERKKGRWERHYSRPGVFADLFWHCSCCGYKNENQYANVYHKFCPHCGADMRGEDNG